MNPESASDFSSESRDADPSVPAPAPKPRRLRLWLARLSLMTVTLLICLLLLEIALRIVAPLDTRANSSWYQAHEIYQFRHRSNLDEEFAWVQLYHLQTNSRGLREDRDIPYEADAAVRVVVHGDSLTFGNGVEANQTYVRLAEAAANEHCGANARVELVNLGVSAHSPGLEYLYYREEGRRYQARIVVIAAFCGNDVGDEARFPAFQLKNDGQLEALPYRISFLKRLTDNAVYQWLIRRSQLMLRLRQVFNAVDQGVIGREQVVAAETAFRDEQAFEKLWPLAEVVWTAFGEAVRADGATPLFLILPTSEIVDAAAGRPPSGPIYTPTASRTREKLLELCRKNKFDVLDLAPPLAGAGVPGETLYLAGDYHFNEQGHAIVGEVVAEKLCDMLRSARGSRNAE